MNRRTVCIVASEGRWRGRITNHNRETNKGESVFSKSAKATLGAITAGLLILTAACGGQKGDASGEAKAGDPAKTILVATSGTPAPMTIVNEDGSITGYEIDLLKEADKLIDDYNFKYEQVDFKGITGGLDSGKYQIGANFFNYTPERAAKFVFSKHSHYKDQAAVLTRPGFSKDHKFTKFSDLGGYKVPTDTQGSAFQIFVEDFNKLYPNNPIKITYTEADHATRLRQISQGEFDYGYGGRFHQKVYAKDLGVTVDYVPIPESLAKTDEEKQLIKSLSQETHYLFPKTDEGQKIADEVDDALVQLHKNGKMQELSKKYFGYDMTGDAADWK